MSTLKKASRDFYKNLRDKERNKGVDEHKKEVVK